MKKTTKRMLGMLMTMSMVMSLAPAAAYAEESYGIWVEGVEVTSENADDVLDDGSVSYDADENTLMLDGAKIKYVAEEDNCPAAIWSFGDLNIELDGENRIHTTVKESGYEGYGIYVEGNLAVFGDSVDVTVNAETGVDYAAGICVHSPANYEDADDVYENLTGDGDILITDGAEVTVEVSGSCSADAIYADSVFLLNEGVVNAQADARGNGEGFACGIGAGEVLIVEGEVYASASGDESFGIWAYETFGLKDTFSLPVTAEGSSAALVVCSMNDDALDVPAEITAVTLDETENSTYIDWMDFWGDDCLTYYTEDGEIAKEITFESALKVTVEADEKTVKPGDEVLFTITLENMLSEPIGQQSLGEDVSYLEPFEYEHAFPIILVKDTMDKNFEEGWFCDADGDKIETMLIGNTVYEVEDVVPVCEKDIVSDRPEPAMELMDADEVERAYPTALYPGEKAVLYYMAVVSDDAKKGDVENTATARALIGEEGMAVMDADEDETLEDLYDMLSSNGLVSLDVEDTASVEVKAAEKTVRDNSVTYEKPDVEVIGEGASVYVGRRFVSVFLEEGHQIAEVTVNGKAAAVPADGRIDGLDEDDTVVIRIVAEGEDAAETPAAEEKNIVLTINEVIAWVFDAYVANDVAPVIRNGRTVLPARFVVEALGGSAAWDEAAQKVTVTKEDTVLEIFIDEPFAVVNGKPVELDAPAFIENDRTYLPLRFIAEYLDAEVVWDADAKTVTITPAQ